MSEYINGYVTKLTNKIKYRLYKTANDIVADPEAESYAAEQQKLKEEEKKKDGYTDTNPVAETVNEKIDDSGITGSIKKIWDMILPYLKIIFVSVTCLILSSYVANEMIVYPVPIRVLFFIFTLILSATSDVAFGSLLIFYICKRLYQYYADNYGNLEEKQYIMPYLFALLPITCTKEDRGFIKNRWSYPRDNEYAANRLTMIMDEYKKALDASFPFLESVKGDDIFSKGLEKFDKAFKDIHKELPKETKEVEESKVEESKVEESKVEESKVEESKVEESKVEESKEKNKPIVTNTALDKKVDKAVKIAANKTTPINSSVLVPTTPVNLSKSPGYNKNANLSKPSSQLVPTGQQQQGPVFYQPQQQSPQQQPPQQKQQGPVFYQPQQQPPQQKQQGPVFYQPQQQPPQQQSPQQQPPQQQSPQQQPPQQQSPQQQQQGRVFYQPQQQQQGRVFYQPQQQPPQQPVFYTPLPKT